MWNLVTYIYFNLGMHTLYSHSVWQLQPKAWASFICIPILKLLEHYVKCQWQNAKICNAYVTLNECSTTIKCLMFNFWNLFFCYLEIYTYFVFGVCKTCKEKKQEQEHVLCSIFSFNSKCLRRADANCWGFESGILSHSRLIWPQLLNSLRSLLLYFVLCNATNIFRRGQF